MKLTAIVRNWFEWNLPLLGMVKMIRMYIASEITYRLPVAAPPDVALNNLERTLSTSRGKEVNHLWSIPIAARNR